MGKVGTRQQAVARACIPSGVGDVPPTLARPLVEALPARMARKPWRVLSNTLENNMHGPESRLRIERIKEER